MKPALLIFAVLGLVLNGAPPVVYHGKAQEFLDLSEDEQWVLARGRRSVNCKKGNGKCAVPMLAVYNAATGKQAGAWEGEENRYVRAARFVSGNYVLAAVDSFGSGGAGFLRWDWRTDTAELAALRLPKDAQVNCILDDAGSMLTGGDQFMVVHDGQSTALLPSTGMANLRWNFAFDCRHWRNGGAVLAATSKPEAGLSWVDLGGAPALSCAAPADHIHNYAISNDGTLVAIITGRPGPQDDDSDVMAPGHKVFLEVLKAPECRVLRRFELEFPEQAKRDRPFFAPKNEYWANARLRPDFAKPIAISPDNKTIAFGYGIRTGGIYSDSVAYFARYSLETGKRLGAFTGDRFRNNLAVALFVYFDNIATNFAPLGQTLLFTRDGKTLYASSDRIYRWTLP